MSTWIKFCGTTCLEDALASIEAGADALGFIFAPSKRQVTTAQAKEIVRKLPREVERIGVFVNETTEQIRSVVIEVGLTGVQLHGSDLAPSIYDHLPPDRRDEIRIIRTVLVDQGVSTLVKEDVAAPGLLGTWLLDAGAGSGKTFDWPAARIALGDHSGRFIIAGGLTPENVSTAIGIFDPFGVDVVSGIESTPGRKDPEKMRAFVAAVRKAEKR
jgi:phosphoribosylanthranilate isomerase